MNTEKTSKPWRLIKSFIFTFILTEIFLNKCFATSSIVFFSPLFSCTPVQENCMVKDANGALGEH